MAFEHGKWSTILISLFVVLMGVVALNPTFLQALIGDNFFLRYGGLILALALAFYNDAYPRLQLMLQSKQDIAFTNGNISSYLLTAYTIGLGVLISQPDLIAQVIGSSAWATWGTFISAILLVLYNGKFPRGAESITKTDPSTDCSDEKCETEEEPNDNNTA